MRQNVSDRKYICKRSFLSIDYGDQGERQQCLLERRLLAGNAQRQYAEDSCSAGRRPRGSCEHIAAEEFVRLHGPSCLARRAYKLGISHDKKN